LPRRLHGARVALYDNVSPHSALKGKAGIQPHSAMALLNLLADSSGVMQLGVFLPVTAGVVAGLGVVGAIHWCIRPRMRVAAAATAARQQQPEVLDPFIYGSSVEQRKNFRREGNPVEVLIVNQQTKGPPMKGYVVNRSVGGLGLLSEIPMDVEAQLAVRPTNAPHMAPWVEVVVKVCNASRPGWEIGCQFVKTPPWAVLLMFG
jgi:hypothetical protein